MVRVCIIGQGYVGLAISVFASTHYEVVGFDLNSTIVSQLNKGISHIEGVDSKNIKDGIASHEIELDSDIEEDAWDVRK